MFMKFNSHILYKKNDILYIKESSQQIYYRIISMFLYVIYAEYVTYCHSKYINLNEKACIYCRKYSVN